MSRNSRCIDKWKNYLYPFDMFAQTVLKLIQDFVTETCGGNYTRAGGVLGVNPHTLRKWLLGERTPNLDDLGRALDSMGVKVVAPSETERQFEFVPKVCAKAGAGSSLETSDAVQALYAFRRDFLRHHGIQAEHAVMMDVLGASMEPLILDGDTILVDKRDTTLRDGYVFLVGFGEDLLVKRLQRSPRGWLLRSENPGYPPVAAEGEDLTLLRVYGRVRWFGRIL